MRDKRLSDWPSPDGVLRRFERRAERQARGEEVELPESLGAVSSLYLPAKDPPANRERPGASRGPQIWDVYRNSDGKLLYSVRGSRSAEDAMAVVLRAEKDPASFYLKPRGSGPRNLAGS